jgi:hypothetical protein
MSDLRHMAARSPKICPWSIFTATGMRSNSFEVALLTSASTQAVPTWEALASAASNLAVRAYAVSKT